MRLVIPGTPIPKNSTQYSAKRNWKAYPTQQADIDRYAMQVKLQARGFKMLTGAVKIDYLFVMPIPKGTSKKRRAKMIGTWHIKRPDTDNLRKFVNDRMSGIIFKDDSQIAWDPGKKIYGDNPRTEIVVEELK